MTEKEVYYLALPCEALQRDILMRAEGQIQPWQSVYWLVCKGWYKEDNSKSSRKYMSGNALESWGYAQ